MHEDAGDEAVKKILLGLFTEMFILEHLVRNRTQKYEADGSTARQFGVINYFTRSNRGPDTLGAMAFAFEEEPGYTADKLAECEALGFVTLDPPGGRGEETVVSITPAAREHLARKLGEMTPEFREAVTDIPLERLETAFETLRDIRLTLDNLPDR